MGRRKEVAFDTQSHIVTIVGLKCLAACSVFTQLLTNSSVSCTVIVTIVRVNIYFFFLNLKKWGVAIIALPIIDTEGRRKVV